MRRTAIAWVSALALAWSGTASAEEVVLQPTSAWTLDFADEKCSLVRDFGSLDKDGLGLRIDSYGSLTSFQISIIGDRVPRTRNAFSLINFAFSPDQEKRRDLTAIHGQIAGYRFAQFEMTFIPLEQDWRGAFTPGWRLTDETLAQAAKPKAADPAFERTVDSIMVELRRGKEVRLNTGPMGPPMEAMRTCVDDLRKTWGLDPVEQRALTRKAHPDADAVKNVMQDFPRDLLARGINGYLPLRVMVDAEGNATECVVQVPAAPEPFRKAACSNLGTEFNPALDDSGQPVASFYQTAVVYMSGSL